MGGKAFLSRNIVTERKTTKDHLRIQNELVPVIRQMFNTEVKTVEFYRNKETHGDLDLLILNTGNLGNIYQKLQDYFGIVINNGGNCYSTIYENYQVDIIPVPLRNWDCTYWYDWDPTSNIIGHLFHRFGLKYGVSGLVYPVRNFNGRLTKDIVVSKDLKKIFEFADYDYNRYIQGFDTLLDIFEFGISSKYFDPKYFEFENMTHRDKARNKKRDTFNQFIEYIKAKKLVSSVTFDKNKKIYIDLIDEFFPKANLKIQLEKLQIEDDMNKKSSMLFNGNLVMNWTELQGKELGDCLSKFKTHIETSIGEIKFRDWVLNFDDVNDIELYFKAWYEKEYKN